MSEVLKSYKEWQNTPAKEIGNCLLFQNNQSLYNKTISELIDHIRVLECTILELKKERDK